MDDPHQGFKKPKRILTRLKFFYNNRYLLSTEKFIKREILHNFNKYGLIVVIDFYLKIKYYSGLIYYRAYQ